MNIAFFRSHVLNVSSESRERVRETARLAPITIGPSIYPFANGYANDRDVRVLVGVR